MVSVRMDNTLFQLPGFPSQTGEKWGGNSADLSVSEGPSQLWHSIKINQVASLAWEEIQGPKRSCDNTE